MHRQKREAEQLERFDKMAKEVYRVVGAPVHQQRTLKPDSNPKDAEDLLDRTAARRTLRNELPPPLRRLPEHHQRLVKFISPNKEDEPPAPTELLDCKEAVRGILNEHYEHSIDKSVTHESVRDWISEFPNQSKTLEAEAQERLGAIEREVELSTDGLTDIDGTTAKMLLGYGHLHDLKAQLATTIASGTPTSVLRANALAGRVRARKDAGTITTIVVNCGEGSVGVIAPQGCRLVPADLLDRCSDDDSDASDAEAAPSPPSTTPATAALTGRGATEALKHLEKLLLRKSNLLVRSLRHRELLVSKTALRIASLQHELGSKRSVISETRTELQNLFETRGFAGPWAQNDDTSAVEFLKDNMDAILEDLRHELQREAHRTRAKILSTQPTLDASTARVHTAATLGSVIAGPLSVEQIENVAGISDAMRASMMDAFVSHQTIAKLHATVDRLSLQLSISEAELAESHAECAKLRAQQGFDRAESDGLRSQIIALESEVATLEGQLQVREERVETLESRLQTVMSANRIQETMDKMKKSYQSIIENLRKHVVQLQDKIRAMQEEHEALTQNFEREKAAAEAAMSQELEQGQQVYTSAANRLSLELLSQTGKSAQIARQLRVCVRKEVGPAMREKSFVMAMTLLENAYASLRNVESDLLSFQPKLTDACRRTLQEDLQEEALVAKHQEEQRKQLDKSAAGSSSAPFIDPSEAEIASLRTQLQLEQRARADDATHHQDREAALQLQIEVHQHNMRQAQELLTALQRQMATLTKTRSNDIISALNFDRPLSLRPHPSCSSNRNDPSHRVIDEIWNDARQAFLLCKHRLLAAVDTDVAFEGTLRNKLKSIVSPEFDVFDQASRVVRQFSSAVNVALLKPLVALLHLHEDDPKLKTSLRKIAGLVEQYRMCSRQTGAFAIHRWRFGVRDEGIATRLTDAIVASSKQVDDVMRLLSDRLSRMSPQERDQSGVPDRIRDLRDARSRWIRRLDKKLDDFRGHRTSRLLALWRQLEDAVAERVRVLNMIAPLCSSTISTIEHERAAGDGVQSMKALVVQLNEKTDKIRELSDALDEAQSQLIDATVHCEELEAQIAASAAPRGGEDTPTGPPISAAVRSGSASFLPLSTPPARDLLGPTGKQNATRRQKSVVVPVDEHHGAGKASTAGDGLASSVVRSTPPMTPQPDSLAVSLIGQGGADEHVPALSASKLGAAAAARKMAKQAQAERDACDARGRAIVAALAEVMGLSGVRFDDDAAEILLQGYRARVSQARTSAMERRPTAAPSTPRMPDVSPVATRDHPNDDQSVMAVKAAPSVAQGTPIRSVEALRVTTAVISPPSAVVTCCSSSSQTLEMYPHGGSRLALDTITSEQQTDPIVVTRFVGRSRPEGIIGSLVDRFVIEQSTQTRPPPTVAKGPQLTTTSHERFTQTDAELEIPLLMNMSDILATHPHLRGVAGSLRDGPSDPSNAPQQLSPTIDFMHRPHRSPRAASALHSEVLRNSGFDDRMALSTPRRMIINAAWSPVGVRHVPSTPPPPSATLLPRR